MALLKPAKPNKLTLARKAFEDAKEKRLQLQSELNDLMDEARRMKLLIASPDANYAEVMQAKQRYKVIERNYPVLEQGFNQAVLLERKLQIDYLELQRQRAEAVRVLNAISIPDGTWREQYNDSDVARYRQRAEAILEELREEISND